ncbi:pleckstrin homology domain-containing family G member 5 [Lucilia cuprina]|uniref:pleckstrin homology domain-containing family G member 5 n=1 Tax=Lucilia cuprina TaxID=7375 RepID=UPI001F058607|nr:pleckstrin homology domain-containing family G member 5 [Lucilia cuprina]
MFPNTIASISSTLTTAYPLTPSSLSPPLPQYQHSAKRCLSPVRSYHPKIPPYSCTRLSTRLTPTIYTQAPQQQPTTKSLPNNLNSPTSQTPSCTTTTTAACCKSRICSAHVGSAPCSSSNLQLQCSSTNITHHHYHTNKFQSEAFSADTGHAAVSVSSATTTNSTGSQHTLKALPLPSVNDNNAAASTSTLSFPLGEVGSISSTTISSASSLQPPGGCITPTSYKKKSSFLQRKKPILTRSEDTLSFFYYFLKNVYTQTLIDGNALSQSLRRRNLSFTQLTITDSNDNNQTPAFLEAGTSPLQTSLDENTEVENLAGHHLIIMDKDSSRKTLQKAASFGSRNRPPRLLSSASTDESSEVNLTGKQLKQRWSGLFGVKNPQQSQLCELLNNYSKNGVPQKTPATLSFDHPDLVNAIDYLDNRHKSWMDIVESGSMNDSEMRIQTAIWELVTTEVDYIHCLQTVTDLFLACLESVQEEGLLKEVDQHRLFANIRDICEANLKFWTFYLYPMVAHSINTREPLRVAFFQQGFIAFANIFAPYKKYCAEQSTCQFYCKELNRTNSLFTSYLAWCEAQKMCNRLRLADILVRPMQRLTKYSLLLAAIKKHMTDVEEIEAIETMLHTTENFVFSVNNHLTTRQENERLKGVMARIESYDVVDTNNEHLEKMIKQYSQMFDLCGPMKGCASQHVRHLFMEGDHKYKDNLGKVEVHCFLLTDMLLVCKSIAKKGLGTLKVIRQPYLTDRLIVQHSNNLLSCVYLNEFQVAISAFTLQCTEAKNWYEALKRAKMIYTRLKQSSMVNPWDSMRYVSSAADSLGVKKSPMNSSICSHVTSANNSHSGSVEWNDSRNISVDFDKTNSLSSDEGCTFLGAHGFPVKGKTLTTISPQKLKVNTTSSSNMLTVQPLNHLGQSLPNLNLHHSHTNNTLLVPGTANSAHSGNLLLSPSHRGISYPPPSPTR